ncbi:type I-E CRISPR-associated protein Cse1/CasA [Candidatus Entotheonella palauensis]|uniref:type I-E CRISPR-associated protein Cse1/CasA n=1 Tax=Candidatus Entotheonella palauensis TaxID=93172 RepID=UPI000B7CEFD2|nr:type I-E CRISPR-associated protein Cse1/CasA [Candidatus Entotheonella palauensis]
MNLINDPWIPIQRYDGICERIAPWQLTDQHDTNPVVAIHSMRSDFDGVLIQFLIGLQQTTTRIEMEMEWSEFFAKPPTREELQAQYAPIAHAFELNGDGARFMQDFDLPEGETKEIAALLIEAPGGNSLRNNLDHFVKRGLVGGMCPGCAAAALFSLQTNAPSGGVGHRTSLRGGGPLTTLVICDPRATEDEIGATLWRDVWLNVLAPDRFLHASGHAARHEPYDIFPWLAPTRTSEKNGRDTTPDDVHPAQMYWAMPRRIRLDFDHLSHGPCNLCGQTSEALVTQFITKNYGVNYTGPWRHPLTPPTFDKDKCLCRAMLSPEGWAIATGWDWCRPRAMAHANRPRWSNSMQSACVARR